LRPVKEVFDAVVKKKHLQCYFVDGASQDLSEGAVVTWRWDHYGELPVTVKAIKPNEKIELSLNSRDWDKTANDAYDVRILFEFERLDADSTTLTISEEGWKTDADGLKASHENCSGWTHMALCLKAWIEHDIDLRSSEIA